MAESLTISTAPPPLKSMDYALLREKAVKHIQELSGKIWTDDNEHDPGITILEMLAYAITDLGYRTNYNIRDILTTKTPEDIKNFFAAKEIMTMYPVTFNDYRKLLIDVEVPLGLSFCESVGVKNAWIEESTTNEIPFYLDKDKKTLSYTPPNPDVARTVPHCLYNVLLEFNDCELLGDLNSNTLTRKITINGYTGPNDQAFNGTIVEFEVEFARWDTPNVNWSQPLAIRKTIKSFDLKFSKMPPQYAIDTYGVFTSGVNQGKLWITINQNFAPDTPLSQFVADAINNEIYQLELATEMTVIYQQKIDAIFKILDAVKATLMEHRNLGEDFYLYNAIKIDQIALCADVDIANNADVEEVYAQIIYQIKQFLDPTIYFYSLSEMYDKGYTTDQIFEGPLLKHGFIEDKELLRNDRQKTIHVSDLLSIIMDIPGVLAVRKIQIAGIPLDNDDNIPVETVRWCLEIPIEKNYVARLSETDSKLLFFKENLPYRANPDEAQRILDELEANDRPQKLINPSQDIPVEAGEFKDIENYFSIQEEFPLVYGTQSAGLPATATSERKGQAKQLKGYLLFFEQLLADYLSQLFHVKDLFSMNDGKDPNGDPIINKTYFSQSLINLVPDALPLYVTPAGHADRLQAMVENQETFLQRRNRFLSHLAQRFAESFVDYAMIEYKIDAPKAPEELIEDKLAFLNNYPEISSRRFNGFNYLDPCELWHIDNISGLERRVSYLAGVDKPTADLLAFSSNFKIIESIPNPDQYYLEIEDNAAVDFMYSPGGPTTGYPSIAEAKLAMEKVILNGIQLFNFQIIDANGDPIPTPYTTGAPPYRFRLICGDNEVLAISASTYLTGALAYADVNPKAVDLFTDEFYNNPECNRYNLECFMDKYIVTTGPTFSTPPGPGCPEKYTWGYTLNDGASPVATNLLFGNLSKLVEILDPPQTDLEQANNNREEMLMQMLRRASNISNYRYGADSGFDEIFTVVDECGDPIGTSVEEDFNFAIQQQLIQISMQAPLYKTIQVVGSNGNDGTYNMSANVVMSTTSGQLLLKIQVIENISSNNVGGFVRYDINQSMPSIFHPNMIDANTAENYFKVDKDLHRILRPGQKIQVVQSTANNGEYVVKRCIQDGTDSIVYVKEDVPSTIGDGMIEYTVLLPIYKLVQAADPVTNAFYVQPGMEVIAAQELADWIKAKFFSHEGMHVVEHILLRPKYNEAGPALPITAANDNELQNTPPLGNAVYLKQFALVGGNQGSKYFEIGPGDFTADFQALKKIKIVNSPFNDNTYTVYFTTYVGGNTRITVYENIPDNTFTGNLQYSKTAVVNAVTSPVHIRILDPNFVMPVNQDLFITGSLDEVNDGKFHIYAANAQAGGYWLLEFDTKVAMIVDDFLPIDIDNTCDHCEYEDPYSHIISVILPAWQGRFFNQDFRKFMDKLMRLECPAHLVLNICWIDCKQMGEFELHYKQWLQAQANKPTVVKLDVSRSLDRVIDDLTHLRSVYPEGILHDCESDPDGDNAIILNQTIIGNLTVT